MVGQHVDPVVGVGVGQHHGVEGVEVEVALQVGQRAGTGVEPDRHVAALDQVPTARPPGAGVGAAAPENRQGQVHVPHSTGSTPPNSGPSI